MSGSLAPAQNLPPSLYKLFVALKDHREYPFYGIFSKRFADLFYALGFAGWAIALPFCWVLHKKGNPHIDAALGLTMVASLVPAWFLFFEQHTIIHAWMTGRLVSLFCGLGISLAALVAWAYLVKQPVRQISKEQKPPMISSSAAICTEIGRGTRRFCFKCSRSTRPRRIFCSIEASTAPSPCPLPLGEAARSLDEIFPLLCPPGESRWGSSPW